MAQPAHATDVPSRYTRVAIVLHWLIAGFLLLNLSLGWFMEGLPPALKGVVLPLHISAGMSVLVLTALRIAWRLTQTPPPFTPGTSRGERDGAHFVHLLLYAGMVLMPLTGWSILSSHPAPGSAGAIAEAAARPAPPPGAKAPPAGGGVLRLWYVIPLPSLAPIQEIGVTAGGLPAQKRLHDRFVDAHALGGYVMIALLLLHVFGALKHQWIDGEDELGRMGLPRRRVAAGAE